MKNLPRVITRLIIYLPVTLLVIIALALGTPVGSKISLLIIQAVVPNVSAEYKSGTINKALSLEYINIDFGTLKIKADSLSLKWNPVCFIHNKLCVNKLNGKNVVIKIIDAGKHKTHQPKKETQAQFSLPFSIITKQANIDNLKVYVDDQSYSASKLDLAGDWDADGLRLTKLISDGFTMTGVWEHNQTNEQKSLLSHRPKQLSLPTVNLPFAIFVNKAELFNNHLSLDGLPFGFKGISIYKTSWIDSELSLGQLKLEHAGLVGAMSGSINFKDHYLVNLETKVHLKNNKNLVSTPIQALKNLKQLSSQAIQFTLKNDFSNLKLSGSTHGQINSLITGQMNLLKPEIPFQANIKNLTGQWQLAQGLITAKALSLTANGTINSIKVSANGQVSSPYIPKLNINGHAEVHKQGISSIDMKADSPNGSFNLAGSFDWQPTLSWDLDANFTKLKVNQFGDDYLDKIPATTLNGHLKSTASFAKQKWAFNVLQSNLNGTFNHFPLKMSGSLKGNNQYDFDARNFEADILGTVLKIDRNQQTSKLTGTLTNESVSSLLPQVEGQVSTAFTIAKDKQQHPEIWHKTNISRLHYKGVKVQNITLSGIYQPLNHHYLKTSLDANDATVYGLLFKTININVEGRPAKLGWKLRTHGKSNLRSEFTTEQTAKSISINIPELLIHSKKSQWITNKAIHMDWNRNTEIGKINPFCLQSNGHYFCVNQRSMFGKDGKIDLSYQGDINEIIHPFLPAHLALSGALTANSELSWKDYSKPLANLKVRLGAGKLLLYPHRKIPREFPYQFLNMDATLDRKNLRVISKLKAENYAHWDSDISIGIDPQRKIKGHIDLSRIQLAPITEFLPIFNTLSGSVDSNVELMGSLSDPKIKGHITLDNGEVAFIKNPTKFHNIKLDVQLDDKQAQLSSNWLMDKGNAAMTGNLNWIDGFLKGELSIKGQDLTVIEPPLAILTVKPDVKVKISDRNIAVNGAIDVTDGDITITPLPEQGIPLSNDVVFVDKRQQKTTEPSFNFTSNIDIGVSNKLSINGMGLSGNLGGKLSLRQSTGTQPLLFGDIKVQNGNYRFLGQTLSIQKGSLEFVGPAENPTLDIEAVKDINEEDVTVGVKVTGYVNRPKISLFSNPSLEQAEIVSYLLQGRGFSSSTTDEQQNNNNALLLSAALTLGAQAGDHNPIASVGNSAENLASKLGISNVQLNANDDGKLAISGFIGDRLLLKYGYGVFDPGYELTVRYYLLSKLYLESVSSALGQSLDIYYRFDIGSPDGDESEPQKKRQ